MGGDVLLFVANEKASTVATMEQFSYERLFSFETVERNVGRSVVITVSSVPC